MTKETKKITKKYWDSLSEDSRYRALRKVFSNFPDNVNRDYAKLKANQMDWVWDILAKHTKQPVGDSPYKTIIDKTWIP